MVKSHCVTRKIKGGARSGSVLALAPEGIINSTQAPGVGILIDPAKLKTGNPYYIVIKGKRLYGSSPEDVIQKINGVNDATLPNINGSGTPGVGILINVEKAKAKDDVPKYYIIVNGKRYYGSTPEEVISIASKAPTGARTWSQYAKQTAKATGSAISRGAKATGSAISRGARTTERRILKKDVNIVKIM